MRPDAPTLPVLMYHSVSHIPSGPIRPYAVPAPLLAEHLSALVGAGYVLVGLSEALARFERDPTERLVAVTFDDGFRNLLTDGIGALASVGASATVYLAVGHAAQSAGWLGDQAGEVGPLLTWDEVDDLAGLGLEIGNHGLLHTPLDLVEPRSLRRQVRSSRQRLQQRTQAPVLSFAYPYGYHSRRVRAAVAEAGHESACEVGHRLHPVGGPRLAIPRLHVRPDHTGDDVVALVRSGRPRFGPLSEHVVDPGWNLIRRVAQHTVGVRLT